MYAEHSVFTPPADESATIWRYLDLTKFLWTVQNEALYFPRADHLGDLHEGSLPRINVEARQALHEELGRKRPGTEWTWAPGIDPSEPTKVATVKHLFVSCWNVCAYENAALWSVYGRGLAIESSFARLRDTLQIDDPVYIGLVRYIDYERDSIPADNALHAIVHKRLYFENERELRAVVPGESHADPTDDAVWTGDPRPGLEIPVDLETLVARVWVAPGQELLHRVVGGVVDKYGLDVEVVSSSLDTPPRF